MINRKLLVPVLIISVAFFCQSPVADGNLVLEPSSRVILHVDANMSIDEVIRKLYPAEVSLWPLIKQKLIDLNPASFHPNSERLVAGARLKLVDIKRASATAVNNQTKVGHVVRQQGEVTVKNEDEPARTLETNSPIYEGDRISTGVNATVFIAMDDGAEIHLKEDSMIEISEYVMTPDLDRNSSSILNLIRGGLRKLSGAIGSSGSANYELQTGLATIGIRGTEYVIKICKFDDCSQAVDRNDPGARLHAVVLEGAISLGNDAGKQIFLATGEYGTASDEELAVLGDQEPPAGLLTAEETTQFNSTMLQQQPKLEKEESSNSVWGWVLGILLVVAIAL
ncbi:MAG: hypothetical protein DRQ59_09660 [Gammaproteobacteria bacterium]|nr:MAG: hypothetical protein DRQ59_09660 [Gammaproteobacteria bacterium]